MSDNQSARSLSYQQVAKIADIISASGKKVRIDLVRREIGFGDHAQIANYLKKWQNSNNKNNGRAQHRNSSRQSSRDNRNNNQGPKNNSCRPKQYFHQYDDETFTPVIQSTPFCMDIFMRENDGVKALFLSIYLVKQGMFEVIEEMRKEKSKSLSFHKQSERDIRCTKMAARSEINILRSEITKIMMLQNHEINLLKAQI